MLWGRPNSMPAARQYLLCPHPPFSGPRVRYHSARREPKRLDGLKWAKVGESWMPAPAGPLEEVVGAGADMHDARRHSVNRANVDLYLAVVRCLMRCIILRHCAPRRLHHPGFQGSPDGIPA